MERLKVKGSYLLIGKSYFISHKNRNEKGMEGLKVKRSYLYSFISHEYRNKKEMERLKEKRSWKTVRNK